MRVLDGTGLLRVEADEWPNVLAQLLVHGCTTNGTTAESKLVVYDGERCVASQVCDRASWDERHWLVDICVLPYLETP